MTSARTVHLSASKKSIRRFVITEKDPTRAFSWLKAATTAFTLKTLLRHYAKRALTPRSLNVKLGPRRKGHKGRAGWLAYIVPVPNLRMELFEALVEDTEAAGGCSYTWSADYRLRVPSGLNMTEDMAAEFASQVQCPHLVVKAAQGPRYMSAEVYTRLREIFRKYNPNFVYRELAGGHHLHLNTPEVVAPVINKFLAQKFDTSANLDEEHKPQFDL